MLAHMTAKKAGPRKATRKHVVIINARLMPHVGTDKFKGTMFKLSKELKLSPERISTVVRKIRSTAVTH